MVGTIDNSYYTFMILRYGIPYLNQVTFYRPIDKKLTTINYVAFRCRLSINLV